MNLHVCFLLRIAIAVLTQFGTWLQVEPVIGSSVISFVLRFARQDLLISVLSLGPGIVNMIKAILHRIYIILAHSFLLPSDCC